MKNILRKIKRLTEKKFSLAMLLGVTNLASTCKLILDQSYVKRKSNNGLVYFRVNVISKLGKYAKDFTSENERHKNLQAVVACLDSAKIDYFVIPNSVQNSYKVGVLAENRNKFFEELQNKLGNTGMYIAENNKFKRTFKKRQIISDKSLKIFNDTDSVRVYSFILSPNRDILAGEMDGCDVEFWEVTSNQTRQEYLRKKIAELRVNVDLNLLKNTLIAPEVNMYTGILPLDEIETAHITIGGVEYKTYDVFTRKTLQDVDFPIDVVYAWVDGKDPVWKNKFNKYRGLKPENIPARSNTESRYMDRQELKYSLRSLHMYAPFVRNIYIATDGQIPDWLDESVPGVKIVDHKEFFADTSALPVFNSHAIGAQLHRIKGLSDRYLYLNDDVMFGQLVTPQKFFYGNGIAKVPASPALIHAGKPKDYEPAPSSAGKNVRKVIEDSFDRYITHKYKHSPNPQVKEVAYEIEKKYPEIVHQTASSRFRSTTDVQFASQFHYSYAMATGRAVVASMKSAVVNISESGAKASLDDILKRKDVFTLCLNESETPEGKQDEVAEMVHDFFESYYPYPSPWEKK